MNTRRTVAGSLAALALTGCGGDFSPGAALSFDAGEDPVDALEVAPLDANAGLVRLVIPDSERLLSISAGDNIPYEIDGAWETKDFQDHPPGFIAVSAADNNIVSAQTFQVSADSAFSVPLQNLGALPVGVHDLSISVQPCEDEACDSPYTESRVDVPVLIEVLEVPEWKTHQANAAHNGYVPIWIDPIEFPFLWEWRREPSSESNGGINAPVAADGVVYVSTDVYFGDAALVALSEQEGAELWRTEFDDVPALNPPALAESKVIVATSGHEDTILWGLSRDGGAVEFQAPFDSQWGHYLAPTVVGNSIYQEGGFYGGLTYSFDTESGAQNFSIGSTASWSMSTPAADANNVFAYSRDALSVIDLGGGSAISIPDPFGNDESDYHATTVIGSGTNVLAFSGGAFSGRASSNVEHFGERVISSFDVAAGVHQWATTAEYKTHYAVADGLIYAGKSVPLSLDAIDEATGEVVWSWTPPAADDGSFHRNVVATRNLLFTSTDTKVYAIDRATRAVVWTYNEPGMLAITDNRILLLATGAVESDGRLLAFDLR